MIATLFDNRGATCDVGQSGRTSLRRGFDRLMDGPGRIESVITHILPQERSIKGIDLIQPGKSIGTAVAY